MNENPSFLLLTDEDHSEIRSIPLGETLTPMHRYKVIVALLYGRGSYTYECDAWNAQAAVMFIPNAPRQVLSVTVRLLEENVSSSFSVCAKMRVPQ